MVRTQIYLTEQERSGLLSLVELTGMKQSELIREAVDLFLSQFDETRRKAVFSEAAGMWKDRDDLPDFRVIRESLDRR